MCDLIGCADPGPPARGRAGSVGEIYSQRERALKKRARLRLAAIESCEGNVRWLSSVHAYLSQPHMNMCGRPRICIRGRYD